MAAPNIVNVTTITGKSAAMEVTTTATDLVTNDSDSGKVIKLNALYVANIDGTNAAGITTSVMKQGSNNRTERFLTYTITVPADSTMEVINKPIYLEEGDSLRLLASSDSDLHAICSFEEIS